MEPSSFEHLTSLFGCLVEFCCGHRSSVWRFWRGRGKGGSLWKLFEKIKTLIKSHKSGGVFWPIIFVIHAGQSLTLKKNNSEYCSRNFPANSTQFSSFLMSVQGNSYAWVNEITEFQNAIKVSKRDWFYSRFRNLSRVRDQKIAWFDSPTHLYGF